MASADHGSQVPSDEPVTPMWLPALGAALFLIVGIWWATRPSDAPPAASADTAAASAAPSAAPSPPPGTPPGRPAH